MSRVLRGGRRARHAITAILVGALGAATANGVDCTVTSVGITPLNDLGAGLYLGQFQGGLYPQGVNAPPTAHRAAGLERARTITPRDTAGDPDPVGSYVLLSIGMSNTTQEFCSGNGALPCTAWSFTGQAAADSRVEDLHLRIANGALGSQVAATWDSPTDPNYDRVRDSVLAPQGLSESQVAAAWVKLANPTPSFSLPAANADARRLVGQLGDVARALRVRYPNLVLVFFSSRIYAGYADTPLNPEPYAFEGAFGVKWVIEAQVEQMAGSAPDPDAGDLDYGTVAPWLGWGPYLWADGTTPRSDGLTWLCGAFQNDGTHPSTAGQTQVGSALLANLLDSPFARPWFRAGYLFTDDFESGDTGEWSSTGLAPSPSPAQPASRNEKTRERSLPFAPATSTRQK